MYINEKKNFLNYCGLLYILSFLSTLVTRLPFNRFLFKVYCYGIHEVPVTFSINTSQGIGISKSNGINIMRIGKQFIGWNGTRNANGEKQLTQNEEQRKI